MTAVAFARGAEEVCNPVVEPELSHSGRSTLRLPWTPIQPSGIPAHADSMSKQQHHQNAVLFRLVMLCKDQSHRLSAGLPTEMQHLHTRALWHSRLNRLLAEQLSHPGSLPRAPSKCCGVYSFQMTRPGAGTRKSRNSCAMCSCHASQGACAGNPLTTLHIRKGSAGAAPVFLLHPTPCLSPLNVRRNLPCRPGLVWRDSLMR